ncbi:hypothetical protein K2X30_03550 [bacterium]|nr:hypothetical protein [bacterium]
MKNFQAGALIFCSMFAYKISHSAIPAQTALDLCKTLQPKGDAHWAELNDYYKSSLKQFANHKSVASAADQTLTRLLSAKSPAILNWMKNRNLFDAPEDDVVKAWRIYYAETFALSQYPSGKVDLDVTIETFINSVNNKVFDAKNKKTIQKIFDRSKNRAVQAVQKFRIPPAAQSQILKRIRDIDLYWMKAFATSKFRNRPQDFILWGVAYDPVGNKIQIGVETLNYLMMSEDNLMTAFAHEIGHSFDSCRWGSFYTGDFPFNTVAECLRTSESVGAKKRDDGPLAKYSDKPEFKEVLATLKSNPTCNVKDYPPPGVQADQLPESFADWFAAEVMSLERKLAPSMRADLCVDKTLTDGSSYPANRDRLEKIYLAQPTIRKELHMSSSTTPKYCSVK